MKRLSKEELQKLSPERLLAYLDSVRATAHNTITYLKDSNERMKQMIVDNNTKILEEEDYLSLIKSVMKTKPHVVRKPADRAKANKKPQKKTLKYKR